MADPSEPLPDQLHQNKKDTRLDEEEEEKETTVPFHDEEHEKKKEILSELMISADSHVMVANTFLKKADTTLMYNEPWKQLAMSIVFPILIVFFWLCIPLTGEAHASFLLFSFVFEPIMVMFHCFLLWTLFELYIPTPSNKKKLLSVFLALLVDVLVLLNLLWSDKIIHGSRIVIIIALFGICVPIFLISYRHCMEMMRIGKIGKSGAIGARSMVSATEELASEYQPLTQGRQSFFKLLLSNIPSDPILVPWKPASLKKRLWSIFIGIVFDVGIYSFLIILSFLMYNTQNDTAMQFGLAIAMYFIEIATHKISSMVSIRLDQELCFEIPQYIFHSFFIDLIFYSYNRNVLFLSVSSYTSFALWQIVHILDDTYAGLFSFFSFHLKHIPIIGFFSTPNVDQVKSLICVQYFGKKQAQFFSNLAFLSFMFFLKYYWNRHVFPYEKETHMEMLVIYSIVMFVVDISTGALTLFLMNRELKKNSKSLFNLIEDFYSYPKVGLIVTLLSLLSLQYTYTSIFFTQNL